MASLSYHRLAALLRFSEYDPHGRCADHGAGNESDDMALRTVHTDNTTRVSVPPSTPHTCLQTVTFEGTLHWSNSVAATSNVTVWRETRANAHSARTLRFTTLQNAGVTRFSVLMHADFMHGRRYARQPLRWHAWTHCIAQRPHCPSRACCNSKCSHALILMLLWTAPATHHDILSLGQLLPLPLRWTHLQAS